MRKILIVGGGYAGFYTAKKLEKWLGRGEAAVTMVDPLPYMTYQPFLPEIAGYSAGGMPDRVKCLHALAAHSLAAGPGVNPIGDLALERATWSPERCQCTT